MAGEEHSSHITGELLQWRDMTRRDDGMISLIDGTTQLRTGQGSSNEGDAKRRIAPNLFLPLSSLGVSVSILFPYHCDVYAFLPLNHNSTMNCNTSHYTSPHSTPLHYNIRQCTILSYTTLYYPTSFNFFCYLGLPIWSIVINKYSRALTNNVPLLASDSYGEHSTSEEFSDKYT